MPRSVPEWVGRTDDHRAPPKVRQRIFDRDNTCHLCSQPIQIGQKWDMDHVVALINGGENRESNLRTAHRKCHKEKTVFDVAEKAKIAGIRQKYIGAVAPKQTVKSAGFRPSEHRTKREARERLPALPPRPLYREIGG